MEKIEDGVALFYIKDEKVLPVAMSKSQYAMLQILAKTFEPLKVVDVPLGDAIPVKELLRTQGK